MHYNFNKKLLKKVMKEKKISRDDLASLLTNAGFDISTNGVNYWFRDEKNKPEIDKAKAISEILDIPFNELVKQNIFIAQKEFYMRYTFLKTNLKKILKERGITHEQLVIKMNNKGYSITLGAIRKWLQHKNSIRPSMENIEAICDTLDINIYDIVEQDIFTITNTQHGDNNTNIQGNNNIINIDNDELSELPNKEKFTTPKFREFLQLYSCYGNEKMLDPIIDKIKKAKEILES